MRLQFDDPIYQLSILLETARAANKTATIQVSKANMAALISDSRIYSLLPAYMNDRQTQIRNMEKRRDEHKSDIDAATCEGTIDMQPMFDQLDAIETRIEELRAPPRELKEGLVTVRVVGTLI